ncbi:MAG: FecR family protein, partial [Butyricimonas faecihominis]
MEKIDPRIELVIYRFLRGEISVSEREMLESWLREGRHRELFEKICNKENMLEKSFYFDRLDKGREKTWLRLERATGLRRRLVMRRWTVAASLMVPLLIGIMYLNMRQVEPGEPELRQERIVPGVSTARLYLPDGKVVDLGKDSICDLQLFEGGRFVNERGTLTYKSDSVEISAAQYSEIRIPRGGEYKVVLPDGTVVWLNAESSLRFPTVFTGKERKVYAKGELYFDVKHDEAKPFIVEVEKDYTVRVLGTEFNIRAYGESSRATTLVKGRVQVKGADNTVLLK